MNGSERVTAPVIRITEAWEHHHGAPGCRGEETECEDGPCESGFPEFGSHERVTVLDDDNPMNNMPMAVA